MARETNTHHQRGERRGSAKRSAFGRLAVLVGLGNSNRLRPGRAARDENPSSQHSGHGHENKKHEDVHRFYSVEIDMDLLCDDLDRELRLNHKEQERRIRDGEGGDPDDAAAAQNHLHSPTAPPSLGSVGSVGAVSEPPDSASSRDRRIAVAVRLKAKQEFINLVRRDRRFHEMMGSLAGIREWWEANRKEWQKMREPIDIIDASITNLKDRIKDLEHKQNITPLSQSEERDELIRRKYDCYDQVRLLEEEKDRLRPWFTNRLGFMKTVKRQFKDLKAEAHAVSAGAPRPTVLSIAEKKDFVYDLTRASVKDLEVTSWRQKKKTFNWWLNCAYDDLEEFDLEWDRERGDNDTNRSSLRARSRGLEARIATHKSEELAENLHYDNLIASLQAHLPVEPAIWRAENRQLFNAWEEYEGAYERQVVKIGEAEGQKLEAKKKRDAQQVTFEGLRQAIDNETSIYDTQRHILEDQRGRNRLVLSTVMKHRKDWSTAAASQVPHSNFNALFHAFVCVHRIRNVDRMKILKYSRSNTLQFSDKLKIMNLTLDHDGNYYERVFGNLQRLPQSLYDNETLDLIVESYRDDNRKFSDVLQDAKTLYDKAKAQLNNPLMSGALQERRKSAIDEPLDPWLVSSMEQAADILEEKICIKCMDGRYRRKSVWEFLSKLVTQPDIFQGFQATAAFKNRKVLLHWISSAIEHKFSIRQIEAFVLACHFDEVLFKLHDEEIVAIDHGWELIDEVLYDQGSPVRRLRIVEPPRANDIERLMRRCQGVLQLDGKNRDVDESWLLEQLNDQWKRTWGWTEIDREILHNCLVYYSSVGKYFRFLKVRNNLTQSSILHRINNGWPIVDLDRARFLPLSSTVESKAPSYFKQIQKHVLSPRIQSLIARYKPPNEKLLYDLVYDELKKHGTHYMGNGKGELTRGRFHLFLRFSNEIGELFRMYQSGRITPRKTGWGTVCPDWDWMRE